MIHRSIPASGAALTCLLLLAAVSGCGSELAGKSGGSLVSKEGRIAFTRATSFEGADLESEIYTINVDGSEETRLTDSPGLDGFPAWSPDGERIIFTTDRDGNWELYVMDADGSNKRRLTNTPEDETSPAFSLASGKIVFVTNGFEDPRIRVMDADGTNRKHLAAGNWPTWSPDGERICFTIYPGGFEQLAVMNADGTEQRPLTDGRGNSEAAWSPDGGKIAFMSANEDEDIYVMNADGTGRKRLTDDVPGNDHWPPTWSPESDRIAFTSDSPQGSSIYVMNSNGSGLTKLTDGPVADVFPAWRP